MTTMSDLVEFLRARLDEDERVARAAGPGIYWSASHGGAGSSVDRDDISPYADSRARDVVYVGEVESNEAEHIARHDPARVLADVESKRRIVAELEHADPYDVDYWGGRGGYDRAQTTLRLLALPYASHPDYDPRWKL